MFQSEALPCTWHILQQWLMPSAFESSQIADFAVLAIVSDKGLATDVAFGERLASCDGLFVLLLSFGARCTAQDVQASRRLTEGALHPGTGG
jgi:hypothetical protein